MSIQCPCELQINIVSALYGRESPVHCPPPHRPHPGSINCRSPNSLARVRHSCQGKTNCSVEASNSVFGDPCHGTSKYLEVEYNCMAPETEWNATTICTNEYMELSIPKGQLPNITLNNLHWGTNTSCVAQTDATHYIFRTGLYSCGTQSNNKKASSK
ncbi:L-rhamnose-binding lectin ELEL-1-like [Branchiostoma floridae x Branchiostoma japonicum]